MNRSVENSSPLQIHQRVKKDNPSQEPSQPSKTQGGIEGGVDGGVGGGVDKGVERVEDGRNTKKSTFKVQDSAMCEYMVSFIAKLLELKDLEMRASVLENITVFKVVSGGGVKWCQVVSDGVVRWCCQVVLSGGGVRWWCVTGLCDGVL